MKKIYEKIEDFVLKIHLRLNRKHPKLYILLNGMLLLSICIMLSFLPYIYKAIAYSVFYEKEVMSGSIEDIVMEKRPVAKRYESMDMPIYYFVINNTYVLVTPSILREYEEGNVYEFFQYTRDDKVIGDSRDYSLLWGIVALLIEIIINYILISLLWFYIDTDGKLRKKRKREFYAPVDYTQLSVKELYKICRGRGLRIMESKRKNKKYLEECLRNDDSIDKNNVEHNPKYERWERVMIKIEYMLIILICISFCVFFYHFIYLHT